MQSVAEHDSFRYIAVNPTRCVLWVKLCNCLRHRVRLKALTMPFASYYEDILERANSGEQVRRQHKNHAARRRWEHIRSERIALENRMRVLERAGLVPRKLTVAEKAVLPSEMLNRVRALEAELMRKAQWMLLQDRQRLYTLAHGPISLASKQK